MDYTPARRPRVISAQKRLKYVLYIAIFIFFVLLVTYFYGKLKSAHQEHLTSLLTCKNNTKNRHCENHHHLATPQWVNNRGKEQKTSNTSAPPLVRKKRHSSDSRKDIFGHFRPNRNAHPHPHPHPNIVPTFPLILTTTPADNDLTAPNHDITQNEIEDSTVHSVSSEDESPTISANIHYEYGDDEDEDENYQAEEDFYQRQNQIFMRFSSKGLNRTNKLKIENNLKKAYESISLTISTFRKILKIEQMYSRLSKNIAKKRAIVKLLNDVIAEDKKNLQSLGSYYEKKLKRYRQQQALCKEMMSNTELLSGTRKLEKALSDKDAPLASNALPSGSKELSTVAGRSISDANNQLAPGHLIYLLTLNTFTCTLCIHKLSGSDIFILDCCRQHICSKCYSKCKMARCPFCRKSEIMAFNFFSRVSPSRSREPSRCHITENVEMIDQADDFDDEIEIYKESSSDEFAKKHLDDMSMYYIFHHI